MRLQLMQSLACPKCHSSLQLDNINQKLICHYDELVYIIQDNIPVLLETEALPLSEEPDL